MSTTTNFKRVALVAVAALGLGVLSSVPAQAVINAPAIAVTNGTAALGSGTDTATAAILSVTGLATVGSGDTITVTFINKGVQPNTSAVPRMQLLDTNTATAPNAATLVLDTIAAPVSNSTSKVTSSGSVDSITASGDAFSITSIGTAGYVGARFIVQLESTTAGLSTAGVFNYTAIVTTYSGTTLTTTVTADFTITIAALASASLVASPTYSTAYIGTSGAGADAVLSKASTASNTAVGYLNVTLKNASNAAVALESVTITTTIGQVGTSTNRGRSVVLKATAGGDAYEIYPDGTAGTATITISTPSVTFATKTMNFYAAAASKLTATVPTPRLALGANTDSVRITATDAAGNPWTGTAYIYASTAADALIAGSNTTPVECAYDANDKRQECPITGNLVGKAKMKIIDASTVALATATSNEVEVEVRQSVPATVKISFDKATYAPNERARIYVTPFDSSGVILPAGTYGTLLATGGIVSNGALSFTGSTTTSESLTGTSHKTIANSSSTTGATPGAAVYTVYMPAAGGVVTLTATGGTQLPAAGQVALTASATVTDSGAAALAAVTALATTVASLKTLITTLTNLVLKIQKKVKA